MNIINMAEELFVRTHREIVPIPDDYAETMKNNVLSAKSMDHVMFLLKEGVVSKYAGAGRFTEILGILSELQRRPFMQPAAMELYLKQGSICESMREYAMALDYYNRGIAAYATMIEPDNGCGYWLFNNAAFCHDYEKLFPEAQKLAEKAISIDKNRHNAWKNRGISLEYQNNYLEAAACYITSYIKCDGGNDLRPMMHLERMFKRHDGLKDDLAKEAKKIMGKIFSGSFKAFCLAETYYHCGHFDKAIIEYEKFYAVAPSGYENHLKYAQNIVKELKELKRMEEQFT